jgi:GntR family transcriptional regulator
MDQPVDVRPSFRRIYDHLLARVGRGEWRPGELVPGEHALAGEYAVSVGTMRKALDILQAEGVIERRRGRGTVVRRQTPENTYFSYFRFRNAAGQLEVPRDRITSHGEHPASAAERSALQLAPGALVHRIRRVRLAGDKPFATDAMAFPSSRFAQFTWPREGESDTSYGYLERSFGVLVAYVQERLRVCTLGTGEARQLGAPAATPALEVLRTAFDLSGMAVEYRRTVALTGRHHYLSELRQAARPAG